MNDDASSELWLLASAYLDGELDAAQRARAEADQAVMGAVDDLRSLRSELRSVTPPAPLRRQQAIAAALAEFDALHEALDGKPVTRRLGAGRSAHPDRGRATRWLGAVAAAVVVLGALGVVASSGLGGSDDDDAAVGGDAASDQDAVADQVLAADEPAERAASATEEATAAAAESGVAAAGAGMDATAAEAAASTMAPSATQPAAAPTMAEDAALSSTGEPIADPAQLAAVAAQLLEQQRSGQLVNTPETSCGTDQEARPLTVLAEGLYLIDPAAGATRDVFIAVDEAAGQAVALDRSDCATIAAAPLP